MKDSLAFQQSSLDFMQGGINARQEGGLKYSCNTGCSLNIFFICFFIPRILERLPPIAFGCTKNDQPIGVTVHSH